ncbi:CAAX amino protease [Clostridia bacterium]|nr:CAAX amino protease [Clostridia bacterium]
MNDLNSKGKTGLSIVVLFVLLIVPIVASSSIGLAVTAMVYGKATVEFYMSNPWPGFMVGALVAAIPSIIIYRFCGKRVLGQLPESSASSHGLRELLLGIFIGGGTVTIATFFFTLFGVYHIVGSGSVRGVLIGLALGIGSGVAEEILFRGVVLKLLFEKYGAVWAIIQTSIMFALIHYGNNTDIAEVIGVFVGAGLLLNGVWFLTKRVWVCIGTHFAWNFFLGGVFGMPVSGIAMEGGIFKSELRGSELITGGVNGPEASVLFVAVTAVVGIAILSIAWKRGGMKQT